MALLRLTVAVEVYRKHHIQRPLAKPVPTRNVLQFLVQNEKLPPFDRGLFHVKTTGENKIEADFLLVVYRIKQQHDNNDD